MPPKSGRHYIGNFDLPTDTPKSAPVAVAAAGIPAQAAYREPSSATTTPHYSRDEYVHPDKRLTEVQQASLQMLTEQGADFNPDVLLQAKNVVRGNLKRVVSQTSEKERGLLKMLNIPW